MNPSVHPSPKKLAEPCLVKAALLPCCAAAKTVFHIEEQPASYATIDGSMVTFHAGSNAVSSGAGIFIGDYFVGIADNCEFVNIAPFVRY